MGCECYQGRRVRNETDVLDRLPVWEFGSSFIGNNRDQMRIARRTFMVLIVTTYVPVVMFFLLGIPFGVSAIFNGALSGTFQEILLNGAMSVLGWSLIGFFLVIPISLVHVFVLGLPLLLVSWHFRAIRWWSTLLFSFIVGTIPSTIFWVFVQTIDLAGGGYSLQNVDLVSVGLTITSAVIMGGFGLCAGIAFWFMWRYWASPDSPQGRPLSEGSKVESQLFSAHE
jgi:hypothetical protein